MNKMLAGAVALVLSTGAAGAQQKVALQQSSQQPAAITAKMLTSVKTWRWTAAAAAPMCHTLNGVYAAPMHFSVDRVQTDGTVVGTLIVDCANIGAEKVHAPMGRLTDGVLTMPTGHGEYRISAQPDGALTGYYVRTKGAHRGQEYQITQLTPAS